MSSGIAGRQRCSPDGTKWESGGNVGQCKSRWLADTLQPRILANASSGLRCWHSTAQITPTESRRPSFVGCALVRTKSPNLNSADPLCRLIERVRMPLACKPYNCNWPRRCKNAATTLPNIDAPSIQRAKCALHPLPQEHSHAYI